MVASQPQRGWELQDQPTPPPATFDQKPRGMPGYGPSQHSTEAPRWPFQDVEDDDTKHPPPPPPPAAPPTLQPPPQVPPYQQHQPPLSPRPPSHTRHILRYWALELATVFTAICLLVAIIALLAHYDGKYMPEWPFEINLNSAIAFLSTFLRAAIVAAVAEIIGQIKWTWFAEQTRPLHHLQDFDAASRSILGSMKLLGVLVWNLGFSQAGLLAIGAALVTIASLAVGPVTQQAVRTTTCPVLSQQTNSSIPVANYVPGSSSYYRVGAGSYELEVDMKSTMIQGITDPGSQDSNVQVVCPSGNCTWSDWGTGVTHASIGMCSKCIDTTEFVSKPNRGGNLTLPDNGAYINILAGQYMWVGYSNLTAYSKLFSDEFAAAADVSLANFTMLMVTKSPCSSSTEPNGAIKLDCPHSMSQSDDNDYLSNAGDYIATSCVLYPCLKEYAAHYENNTLTEKLVRTTTAVQNAAEMAGSGYYSGYGNYTAIQSPCVLDNGTWYNNANQSQALDAPGRTWANISAGTGDGEVTRVPNACLYKMQGTFFSALSNFMSAEFFTASCRYDSMQSGHINCRDAWWLTPLWAENNATVASLTAAVDDFAWAVTNKLRMTGLGPDVHQGLGALVRHAEVLGEVWASTTCTYFDSKYLALPIVLVLLCAILLGWIIAKNYTDPEQPVWKGSVLPLLFFGLHNGAGGGGGRPGTSGGGARDGNGEPRGGGGGGLARNMSFFREGRSAPELDRIQHESGRLWVRFHGGTDPGFLDLGTKGRRIDVEAIDTALGSGNASKGESRGRSTIR